MGWNDSLSTFDGVWTKNFTLPCPILGLIMSNPVVFGFDINPVGSLLLVDEVFGGVVFGMEFTTLLPVLDDWILFNLPNSADVAKSFPPPDSIIRFSNKRKISLLIMSWELYKKKNSPGTSILSGSSSSSKSEPDE